MSVDRRYVTDCMMLGRPC